MNEVALITGAAGGIGQAIFERLLARRMRLVLVDIDVTCSNWPSGSAKGLIRSPPTLPTTRPSAS